jgi:hypothetical protein
MWYLGQVEKEQQKKELKAMLDGRHYQQQVLYIYMYI